MHAGQFLLLGMSLWLLTGCNPKRALVEAEIIRQTVLDQARTNVPSLKEMYSLYPDAKTDFYTERFRKGTSTLQAAHLVFDRYMLTVKIDIEVDAKNRRITSFAAPVVTLEEIVAVSGDTDGQLKLKHGDSFRLTPDQWSKVAQTGGQFGAVGIHIITNQPAPGIEEFRKYLNMSRDY